MDGSPSFDRVASFERLASSARRAAKGKVHSNETARFLIDIEEECLRLRAELLAGNYRPSPYRTFQIEDPKPRTISAAAFRDRVVHHALCEELIPTFERGASPYSYACRIGGGQHRALQRCQNLVRSHAYVLQLDIEHFFETLSHAVLMRLIRRRLRSQPRLVELCGRFIHAGAPGSADGCGVPIGNLTSQHFANFYLAPLDRLISAELRLAFVRYMDDLRIFSHDKATLWRAAERIEAFVTQRLNLRLKAKVTQVYPVSEGVPFLGFRIFKSIVFFDNARRRRFIGRWRQLERMDSAADAAAVQASAISLIGWAAHGSTRALRRSLWVGRVAAEEVDERSGSNRVNRGGNWGNNAQNARAANRNNNSPGNRNNNIGFRLCSTRRHAQGVWPESACSRTRRASDPRPVAHQPALGR